MTQSAHKLLPSEYAKYNTTPYEVDKNIISKYRDDLFVNDEEGFPRLNVAAWEKLSYEHLENLKTKTMVPQPTHRDPEPHTMQLWDQLNKEWVPFNIVIANSMLTRNHQEPMVRIFLEGEWKNYDNKFLINFLKEGKLNEYDDYLYGSFPPSHYIIDFDVESGTKKIQKTGNAKPNGYVLIEGMEGNYFINPEHLDWLLVNHYEKEAGNE